MSKTNDTSNVTTLADSELSVSCADIEIREDELKQVTGGAQKLPGMNKTSDVTFKRGTI